MPSHDVVPDVWKEACRHIEISESVESIAAILGRSLPLASLIVRRIDLDGGTLETVATAVADGAEIPPGPASSSVEAAAWKRLTPWLREGGIIRGVDVGHDPRLETVVPRGVRAAVLAGPLRSADGPIGVLIVTCRLPRGFTVEHAKLAQRLLEPFAVALENDRRLHELESLREAAEADRESLLTRLGRQSLSEDVVGGQTGLKHVMERVELVATSDVPVLILGDTGTGKEVVSRAIHSRSRQAGGPFIRVNCGAIPPELVDSQLFGHEKGSFTGASEQHQGWFERASGGTLFLDEIGELPLPAQVRLLRVLQDHQIERVGGKSPIHVEVRIVAATHRDLAQMVKDRTFREDLWYRINVFPILLPTLRERIEDIPALVRHFAHKAAVRFGLPAAEPSAADLAALSDYHWPGNIRELGAVIDRAVILGKGRRLDVTTALGFSRPTIPAPVPADATMYEVIPESAPTPNLVPAADSPLPHTILPLNAAMRQHIERALLATRGRIEGKRGAAAILQINPHTLRARMRKLGIDTGRFRE
jgi:hydrogenase-4 transcriptional activator